MDLNAYKDLILFGGSFDPPHEAHVSLPLAAMRKVNADLVIFIPSGVSPFKCHAYQTPAHHRLNMLRLALHDIPQVHILTDEIQRFIHTPLSLKPDAPITNPTYTVDTLEALHKQLNGHIQLRLLLGTDHLQTFHQWRNPQRIIELAEPLVMVRPPDTHTSALLALPSQEDRQQWATRLVVVPRVDVSSTHIRQLVAQHKSIRGLVAPCVEAYIMQHRLYESPSQPEPTG